MAALTRTYIVQSISQGSDGRMTVTLFEDNAQNDANGAPMGNSSVTFFVSTEEGRGFFPGDRISLSLTAASA